MEWITQNWLLIAGGIGIFMLMRWGGMGCGGHSGGNHHRGAGDGGQHDDKAHGSHGGAAAEATLPATDPVSGRSVDPLQAIASIYRGTPVYFESRENRDRFEASPDQYPTVQAAKPAEPGRRHGCC
ncbi:MULTISPECIES: hypothetical protein [Candidatus Accumulibacter]|jgi:YHS domain-containing protein|uniref:hypothetical protein n=1 Tax=Candidatus Accumulibacter TaxID=327159 RepID=UPI0025BFC6EE|nr:hypothetical protein [Candidatus Accumulibacter sp. ACC007]